jgi:TonB family protein
MENLPKSTISESSPVRHIGDPGVSDFNLGTKANQAPSKVKLPTQLTEIDEPLDRIDSPIDPKVATTPLKLDERVGNTTKNLEGSIAQDAQNLKADQIKDRPVSLTGDDYLDHLSSLIGGRSDNPAAYYLEGEILQRTIAKEVVPEYPEGLQKNGTVTIHFNVHSDGTISDLIVTKKDDPLLEELSLNSLKEWRFNAIPQDLTQRGKITFIYQIR